MEYEQAKIMILDYINGLQRKWKLCLFYNLIKQIIIIYFIEAIIFKFFDYSELSSQLLFIIITLPWLLMVKLFYKKLSALQASIIIDKHFKLSQRVSSSYSILKENNKNVFARVLILDTAGKLQKTDKKKISFSQPSLKKNLIFFILLLIYSLTFFNANSSYYDNDKKPLNSHYKSIMNHSQQIIKILKKNKEKKMALFVDEIIKNWKYRKNSDAETLDAVKKIIKKIQNKIIAENQFNSNYSKKSGSNKQKMQMQMHNQNKLSNTNIKNKIISSGNRDGLKYLSNEKNESKTDNTKNLANFNDAFLLLKSMAYLLNNGEPAKLKIYDKGSDDPQNSYGTIRKFKVPWNKIVLGKTITNHNMKKSNALLSRQNYLNKIWWNTYYSGIIQSYYNKIGYKEAKEENFIIK